MSLYYFDVRDSRGFHRDQVGDNFESFEDARMQCQLLLPEITSEEMPDGELHTVWCSVRDETDRLVYHGELTYRGTRFPS